MKKKGPQAKNLCLEIDQRS